VTRTTIATVLATVLSASLAAAQTTTPAKPTVPTTPAAPTMPAAPTAPTMPSTGAAAMPATATPATATPSTTASTTPVITGGSNMFKTEADAKTACTGDTVVWANTSHSKVYHLSGDKYYGHTHHGAYMCLKAATAAGYHAPGASTKAKPTTTTTHS
jgi:hypothetical protein